MKHRLPTLALPLLAALLLGTLPLPCGAAGDRQIDTNVVYPTTALVQNGGRIINLRTPPSGITAATGNGTTDDTAAFQSAFNFIKTQYLASASNSYIIYIPNGTYRITQSIIYTGAVVSGSDINNVRFVGQSRAGVTLKLDNSLAAFQSKTSPTPVLCYQHPSTTFNNIATSNLCENLTVNTGSGNPGAAGIHFQGANSARMSNVTITSADGQGCYGIWFKTGSVQAYLKDITINGFDDAVYSLPGAENDSAFEHLTCTNQNVSAISIVGGGVAVRDLLSNQSAHHVPVVSFANSAGSCVLLDSQLNGGSSTSPAVAITGAQQDLFTRNVHVSGYTVAIKNQTVNAVTGPFISEYCAFPPTTLFAGQDTHSFALPVEDTPIVPWETNLTNWVNVNDYGANGSDSVDDSTAIQAAFNAAGTAGKTVVYFPGKNYILSKTITIPASVRRVEFMFCSITGGAFSVNAASSNPVILVGKSGYTSISINAARTVIAEFISGNVINQQSSPITTFIESCTNMGAGNAFCTAGQQIWARSINDENPSSADVVTNGGMLWILGYKTENKPASSILATGGGMAEVLGGYANVTVSPGSTPMISNNNSSVCYTGFTNMTGTFTVPVSETSGTTTVTTSNTQFPARGGTYASNFFIPLYVGGPRPSGPLGIFSTNEDIGSVAADGAAICYTSGTYFVDGSGADIWNTADTFHFADTSWNGNGTLVALVNSVDNTNGWAKAGLMFRDSHNANGMFVDMLITPGQGIVMQQRTSVGGSASQVAVASTLRAPYWVKLQRTGTNTVVGSYSADGVTWTQLGTATVSLPTAACAGLCVTAHNNNGSLCRAIMSNVTLTP